MRKERQWYSKGLPMLLALALVLSAALIVTGPMSTPVSAAPGPPVDDGLVLHLDASDEDSITTDGNDRVSEWRDLSPSANDAGIMPEGSYPGEEPLWVDDVLSGKPVLRFDGGHRLRTGPDAHDPAIDQPTTVFVVWSVRDTTGTDQYPIDGRGEFNRHIVMWQESHSRVRGSATGPDLHYAKDAPFGHMISTVIFDGPASTLYENGLWKATGNAGDHGYDGLVIGGHRWDGQQYLNGDIAEILVYDRALADEEREQVEQYLGVKWLKWEVWVCEDEGSDENPGTEAEPFETIQKGIDEVAEGGMVHVRPGTYGGDVTITNKSLTLKSTGGKDVTTITGLVGIALDDGQTVVFGGEEDHGFTIDRGNPAPDSGILLSAGNGAEVTISHNTITGDDAGIRSPSRTIAGGSTVTIEHNVIKNCPGHGIHLDLVENGTVSIESNQIKDNGEDGIYIWRIDDAPKTVTITGNTITGNMDRGVQITTVFASNLVIEDNAIQDNGEEGIYVQYVQQASNVDIAGNTIGGDEDDGNGSAGIHIYEILGDSTVTIGGDTEAKGNTISHNGRGVPTTGIHINWVYTSDVIIEYNAITDNQGAGVRIENIGLALATVTITRNTITDNGEAGIYVDRVYSSRLIIEDNTISDNGGVGIYIEVVQQGSIVDIADNTIGGDTVDDGNGSAGIRIDTIEDSTVTIGGDTEAKGNTISHNCHDSQFTGIRIDEVQASDVTIEYNTIADNFGAGIDIGLSVGVVTIARNTITDNTDSGIHAEHVSDSTMVIVENTITDNGESGIDIDYIEGALETVAIARNVIADNGHYGIDIERIDDSTVVIDQNKVGAWEEEWEGNDDGGINIGEVLNGSNVQITANHANENCADFFGIQIESIEDSTVTIEDNETNQNVNGIIVHSVKAGGELYVVGNTIAENVVGLDIVGVEDSTVNIKRNQITDNERTGISAYDVVNSDLTIEGNRIQSNGEDRILIESVDVSNSFVIVGNTGSGIHASIVDDSTLIIVDNNITDNEGAGIRLEEIISSPGTVEILRNTITGNDIGVNVVSFSWSTLIILGNEISENRVGVQIAGEDAPPNNAVISKVEGPTDGIVSIAFNNIFRNSEWGVQYGGNPTDLDATQNWWGDPSGPEHADNPGGTGDKVSDDVDFAHWLGAAMTDQPTGCTADRATGEDAKAETDNVSADATGGDETTTVTVAEYVGDPTDVDHGFAANAFFFDVHVGGELPDQLAVRVNCPDGNCAGVLLKWFDGTEWLDVTPAAVDDNGVLQFTLDDDSSPTIAELTGTPFGAGRDRPVLPPVGGTGHLVNRLVLLAPWLALAATMAGALVFVRRRHAQS